MAKFIVFTKTGENKEIAADYFHNSNGFFEFSEYDPEYSGPMVVFTISTSEVSTIERIR